MMTSLALALVLLQEPPQPEPPQQQDLQSLMLEIENELAEVRGLKFKEHVKAKSVPRPNGVDKGLRGFYNFQSKSIELYDDIGKDYERSTLAHEMVHALDDQHFNLAKVQGFAFTKDAQLAAKALVEGSASYVMVLVDKGRSHVSKMMETQLDKARNVENAFVYGQGARYIAALKEKGGWDLVNRVFRNPPRTTAEILHPGEKLSLVNVGFAEGQSSQGEYGIVARLLTAEETRPLALKAAAGWSGDVMSGDKTANSWTVYFASPAESLEFASAMTLLKTTKIAGLENYYDEPGVNVWHDRKGGVQAVIARGERTYVLEANNDDNFKLLLDRLEGAAPALLIYATVDKKAITYGEFIDRLLKADMILVGETHDSPAHHRVQLQVIKALFAADENLGVGMEMFFRPFQKELDRYIAGETTEEEFLAASQYKTRWTFAWDLYKPIVDFCRRNRIPLAALNALSELTDRVKAIGFDNLTKEEKAQLGDIDFNVKHHRDFWLPRIGGLHQRQGETQEQKERSYQVMTIWDEYMGTSAAVFQETRFIKRMVILAGSGHVQYGWGIAERAAKRTGGKTATVDIELGGVPMSAGDRPIADYVVIVK